MKEKQYVKHWYVMLVREPSGLTRARFIHTSRNLLHLSYKKGCVVEYRACTGVLEAMFTVLIYNYYCVAWLYRIYCKLKDFLK